MQKFVTNLWFDTQAEEAADFYVSLFENSKITKVLRYGPSGKEVSDKPEGSVMTVDFQLDGQDFTAINGGPEFKFTEAISILINCKDQAEIDRLTEALSADPASNVCGWVKDKYGLSWQIVPEMMNDYDQEADPAKFENMMKAMLKMKKLDIAELEEAYNQG
jgi:predicted 3-demethylubiquinone-9 3-methyltransferase (glyoxalase superfamily)